MFACLSIQSFLVLGGERAVNPVEPNTVTCLLLVSPNAVENDLNYCLLLGHARQEGVGVADNSVELGSSQCAFSRGLGAVEPLERNFSGVVEDEWRLNNKRITNSRNSTSLLESLSTLNKFQKT